MHKPLKLKTDYLNRLLEVAAKGTRERGDIAYGRLLGLSLRDVRLLRLVGLKPGISMGELCEASGVEKTLASKLVGALVRRGLVAREIGTRDARQVQLGLTEAGIAAVRRAEPLGKRLENGFTHWLSEDELASLHRLLGKLIEAESDSRGHFEAWLSKLPGTDRP